nr:EOG090X06AF [Lepidurus arcticus]
MPNWGGPSIVEYFAEHEGYKCGYCKGTDSNYSHGMWAHVLRVLDYEDLINRGWRRSGCYCYKPTMNKTCCPQYTIRCLATEFTLTKSHKKVLKRMSRFLKEGHQKSMNREQNEKSASESSEDGRSEVFPDKAEHLSVQNTKNCSLENGSSFLELRQTTTLETEQPSLSLSPTTKDNLSPCNPPLKKAKIRRLERKLAKQANMPQNTHPALQSQSKIPKSKNPKNEIKTLEDFLTTPGDSQHTLEVRLVQTHPRSPEFEATLAESHAIYKKYQTVIHKDKPDEVTLPKFERFLVNSPLEVAVKSSQMPHGYGSFHQQYWLDGKLIAVGVVDILPQCLSSVYFYYDPEYSFLSLGNYASLREIAFVRQIQQTNAYFKYYYMGFYIHTCTKMRYKGNYQPSFLLCPETYRWHPFPSCTPRLDQAKYVRYTTDPEAKDADAEISPNEVLVLYRRQAMRYTSYHSISRKRDEAEVREYASLVGMSLAKHVLLYRS